MVSVGVLGEGSLVPEVAREVKIWKAPEGHEQRQSLLWF